MEAFLVLRLDYKTWVYQKIGTHIGTKPASQPDMYCIQPSQSISWRVEVK